jgi:ankyrin repeat protein
VDDKRQNDSAIHICIRILIHHDHGTTYTYTVTNKYISREKTDNEDRVLRVGDKRQNETALHMAAKNGHVACVTLLLEYDPSLILAVAG